MKASQEVARLTEERDTWRGAYERGVADCERLTATIAERDGEIERLVGRERQSKVLLDAIKNNEYATWREDIQRSNVTEPLFKDCRKSRVALMWPEARAAWLAGCKS